MSDTSAFGFGQFVPGFDFLQNLSKTAAQAQPAAAAGMPGMASWVAPTLNIEDIDKRIQELKSVLFWLEQNTTALKATIQAMEVQKMTLTTLQSMNVNMADLAKAFTVKPPSAPTEASASASSATPQATPTAPKPSLFSPKPAAAPAAPEPAQAQPSSAADAGQEPEPQASSDATADTAAAKPAVDPMQWWGALTQQFQGIAAAALKDVAAEAMKAGTAAQAGTQRTAKVKGATVRKAASVASGPKAAVPSRAKTAPVKPTRQATKSTAKTSGKTTTKSSVSAPRKAAKK
ncbi:MAG: hypothetical protein RJB14_1004 [Pseudomonadota bacterium]|jgi:hypothetical protein